MRWFQKGHIQQLSFLSTLLRNSKEVAKSLMMRIQSPVLLQALHMKPGAFNKVLRIDF